MVENEQYTWAGIDFKEEIWRQTEPKGDFVYRNQSISDKETFFTTNHVTKDIMWTQQNREEHISLHV